MLFNYSHQQISHMFNLDLLFWNHLDPPRQFHRKSHSPVVHCCPNKPRVAGKSRTQIQVPTKNSHLCHGFSIQERPFFGLLRISLLHLNGGWPCDCLFFVTLAMAEMEPRKTRGTWSKLQNQLCEWYCHSCICNPVLQHSKAWTLPTNNNNNNIFIETLYTIYIYVL